MQKFNNVIPIHSKVITSPRAGEASNVKARREPAESQNSDKSASVKESENFVLGSSKAQFTRKALTKVLESRDLGKLIKEKKFDEALKLLESEKGHAAFLNSEEDLYLLTGEMQAPHNIHKLTPEETYRLTRITKILEEKAVSQVEAMLKDLDHNENFDHFDDD